VQVFHQYTSTSASDSVKGNWCFSEEKRDRLECDNTRVRKVDYTRHTSLPEQEEAWVECDHCKRWVHQICGLFNSGRNNANVTYMCPDCLCVTKVSGGRGLGQCGLSSSGGEAACALCDRRGGGGGGGTSW